MNKKRVGVSKPSVVVRTRRATAAESVVAQSRRAVSERSNVVDVKDGQLKQTKLQFDVEKKGSIRVEFPRVSGEPHVLDLSFLSEAPFLAKPLAEGFRVYGVGKSPKSIIGRRSELQTGFISFLRESGLLNLELSRFDQSVWSQFIQWLDKKPNSVKPPSVIEPKTRALTFGAVVAMIRSLKAVKIYRIEASATLDCVPSVRWTSVHTKSTPRARLSLDNLKAIDAAVSRELALIDIRITAREKLLERGRAKLANLGDKRMDISMCAAYVTDNLASGLPTKAQLRTHHRSLYRAIISKRINAPRLGIAEVIAQLYPTARELVPFVLRIAIETAINAHTNLQLQRSDIEYDEILGNRVVRVGGLKGRAAEDPSIPVSASLIEPTLMLLDRVTSIVRKTAPVFLADRLFLFKRVNNGNSKARSFTTDDKGLPISDSPWTKALEGFCADNGLPAFHLSQIRPTLSDEIASREGIVVAANVLGHRDISITELHYVSDGTRWREVEWLGRTMLVMHRWYRTNGTIDPRRRRLTPKMDRGAATPGFHCFDPYDSPIPNQRKNRLCTAYGRCPSCPLAAADVSDITAVALYSALRISIYESQGLIAAQAWRERYAPVLVDLESLLSHVPAQVMDAAMRVNIKLPMVE